ncbi:hypothetical protein [Wenjunlia tyrosinilytica]|jgi:hypothetical protein|uniref:Uncharacterized protein n=1 Tax=Wenjunlia tyrosinilytica TaxID=1544741 RepID=A0A917ZS08_9ACTN|nr:hypothetical protein [Wenjunlia tyrosinilytica]GGO90389.1 hypothetical protein GCM10012280_35830 [Wenjunlia tyrosinilytica]
MSRDLNIICEICEELIDDGQGDLWIDYAQITAARDARARWERERAGCTPDRTQTIVGFGRVLEYPDPAPWRTHHKVCDPGFVPSAYVIEADRLRTWADLTLWTAKLMSMRWLEVTDWNQLLRGAVSTDGVRVRAVERQMVNNFF